METKKLFGLGLCVLMVGCALGCAKKERLPVSEGDSFTYERIKSSKKISQTTIVQVEVQDEETMRFTEKTIIQNSRKGGMREEHTLGDWAIDLHGYIMKNFEQDVKFDALENE